VLGGRSMTELPFDVFIPVVFVGWLLIAGLACVSTFNCQFRPPPIETGFAPSAAVIIPIRGVPAHFEALWRGIRSQIYRPFRVIFAVESVDDPAYSAVRALAGGPEVEIVVAGATIHRSQKTHNLLAALQALRPDDAAIVFADADIVPTADWLMRLIRPLCDPINDAVSGYRWMVPTDEGWWTAMVCIANASVATLLRFRPLNVAWGGSTALRRETLDALDLKTWWNRTLVDDFALTQAVHAHGGYVYGPRYLLVPTPVSYGRKEAIAFGRRQYLYVRMHAPLLWLLAASATTLPLLGWAAAIPLAATGDKLAITTLLIANILDHIRARMRRRISRKWWGSDIPRRMAQLDRWGTPLCLMFHSLIVWSTLFGRTITWAGRTYVLDAQRRVSKIIGPIAALSEKTDSDHAHGSLL
jgi:hypothetical protein